MKKNDVIFLLSAISFSVLFYKQNAGLNFLLFTILVSGLLLIFNPHKRFDPHWWYYAALSIFTGSMVVCVNSALSIFACVCSLLMLSGKTFSRDNSVFLAFAFAVFSFFSSLVYWIIDLASLKTEIDTGEQKKSRRKITGVLISIVIALVFFLLYREANPLFKDLTKYINFDWLNIGWILFTFWGFLVFYGLIRGRRIEFIANFDEQALTNIPNKKIEQEENSIPYSSVIALSLFAILNVMLLLINILDINNIFVSKTLPKGITLSNFVHQAVWSTVASIVIASSLIMWFFKSELNFNAYGKKVKYVVYAWIIQSIIMILSTMIRNSWYLQEYQLTYLRIGVYTFLILSLIGLIHTFMKVAYGKSAWKLVTNNFATWFLLLCLSTSVNWDRVITNYNMAHATETKRLDKEYITRLSDANIPELVELYGLKDTTLVLKNDWDNYYWLERKIVNVTEHLAESSWQSYNLRDEQNREALKTIKVKHYETR
jgi:hypothetical protein